MTSESDIVGPDIPDRPQVDLTDAQLRQVWDRIQLIDKHFDKCCGFQMDKCRYGDEYNQMWEYLHLAGLERWKGPGVFEQAEFQVWLANRGSTPDAT